MTKIKIITDSTCCIPKEVAEECNITVVPLKYIYEDVTYEEGFAGEFEEYFTNLKESNSFPTTSQPSTGDLLSAFEDALMEHDKVIGIFLSSKLSGTFNNAVLAKDMVDSDNIVVKDSRVTVAILREMVEIASTMAKNGEEVDAIINKIEELKNHTKVYLTVDSLEYLSRGGRLSTLEYKVGNVLKVKPIITLEDGELKVVEKVRGSKKALKYLVDSISEDAERIMICHILSYEEAENIKKELEVKFPNVEISIEEIGPVIGSHLGPGALGIIHY